ncbi:Rieske [2Fe-2S] iron-sulfur domain-containing protein [Aspergillus pseudotamarii]|uniref:Choline monooxygenase, chloroplastic n=1 Tax=Aspergillus pseudotamarii TaxID=132259 RepID=A0A5N6SZT1_ASPPS|nr:Rieske [2Fe-2S] iron-sulfur domain-containing protein [Aspergillus pseudotamarii]KAE8140198.1 Rieske [2Fe-2S] iron-sulfur domain-containing protein [Aspergillus pseudotamarii]
MSSIWKNYFGQDEVASSGATPPNTALPANWYTSPEMWELERRAIFSRKWMLITHKMRLPSTGDYLVYDIAGYPFILVRDKDGNFNAFHNVCRHRAFPVVTEGEGKARIFACKYHGWSYGLNGKLAKAPGYQDLDGFDKSKNGLFQIHVHVDSNGFIWANLDAKEQPEIEWEDDFSKVDLQDHFSGINWDEYNFDHTWEMEGEYNWKILADNYNECYHADGKDNSSIDYANSTPEQIARGLRTASTYYFPNASMTVFPHFFFMQRFVPTSATKCTMRFEVYRNKNSSDKDFELISQTYKRIMSEDKDLCTNAQKNLSDHTEKGSLNLQMVVRELVKEHYKKEQEAGREIWPTRQTLPTAATISEEDMTFCNKLDAQSKGSTSAGGCCGGGCQPKETLVF